MLARMVEPSASTVRTSCRRHEHREIERVADADREGAVGVVFFDHGDRRVSVEFGRPPVAKPVVRVLLVEGVQPTGFVDEGDNEAVHRTTSEEAGFASGVGAGYVVPPLLFPR